LQSTLAVLSEELHQANSQALQDVGWNVIGGYGYAQRCDAEGSQFKNGDGRYEA
jgi:hypothetical protein